MSSTGNNSDKDLSFRNKIKDLVEYTRVSNPTKLQDVQSVNDCSMRLNLILQNKKFYFLRKQDTRYCHSSICQDSSHFGDKW